MIRTIEENIELSDDLLKKINWAKNFSGEKIQIEKGKLIKLLPTNIAYVEPHKIKINNYTFLFFNGNPCFYINDYETKYKLSDLELYFRKTRFYIKTFRINNI